VCVSPHTHLGSIEYFVSPAKTSIKTKIEKTPRWQALAASVLARLASVTLAQARPAPAAPASTAEDEQGPPRIVSTSPRVCETEVNPALKGITVTFDRDMQPGFS